MLADQFIAGAKEAGHDVFRFDASFETVKPCLGCEYCASHNTECVHKDSMPNLLKQLLESELIVFVTPLYYYAMSAQIKAVVDRFHAKNAILSGNKKAMLMATSYGDDDSTMEGLKKTYELILRLMNWKDAGTLFATGCPIREVIEQSKYPKQAYEMGKNIK